ncbi:ABC transporter substrate-binding protein [Candidatus Woesearchaeota archaeon]|jgi:ABC-type branched-subunit amino acid transport system substrate-binding protein|nr:ABC transporter substrate-binding protein [Candidatus Woesearchaeota archaeon]MBT3538183.1 ABC transporter substrate-binding protein [Candidatus Woesearchaeota archaeon]MBT4697458.1 ABC transporter substrate-binding protein [Candidatus Woesearchaeota archaeon]MBT4716624.1 ABC transporter substrate-binding protein [Candidatus Woesearchaeota archaeon]MBT7105852.1 ABC transporter substrate-binding protein [Candidatus Woesearchaeota archaeon]
MVRLLNFMVLVLLVLSLVGCGSTGNVVVSEKVGEIEIGVVLPRTGDLKHFGDYVMQGLELAMLHRNNTVAGKNIKLIVEDTKCLPKPTANGLMKLHNVDKVAAVFGPFCGSSSKTAGAFAQQHDFVVVTPSDNFGRIYDYQFHVSHLVKEEPIVAANYLYDQGVRKAGILYYNNDWGEEFKNHFKLEFERIGGEIVGMEGFVYSDGDYRTIISKLDEAGAEAIYFNTDITGNMLAQFKELGYEGRIVSNFEMEAPAVFDVVEPYAEGLIYTGMYIREGPGYDRVVEDYKEIYGFDHVSSYTVYSYDAANILFDALEECAVGDQECLYDELDGVSGYQGVSGPLYFNEEYYGVKVDFRMKQVVNGELVLLE